MLRDVFRLEAISAGAVQSMHCFSFSVASQSCVAPVYSKTSLVCESGSKLQLV